ncbi:transmembrane protein 135-like [Macrosteles quadrilineatus]|uniref:transmembrane protein 135-like n=1 Tax=Macrosteles quadrilineatus TaxID=74068 RepID=UPI0023E2AE33|nr:transmembrane protein 135-like [Macrosteles quadrilineatus]
MTIISKFQRIDTSCIEYVHPWTNSCAEATAGLFLHSILASLRIYVTAYVLTMLMKGKIPSKKDIKYTILGIIQSTAFLSCHAFGYSLTLCCLRKIIGNFNFLTVSFIPSFLSSIGAILVERPSRRSLLSLYVTNVASETLFRMAVWRKWVTPIKYGEVVIFSFSCALLLYLYRSSHNEKDSIYSLLRFFVGPYEEKGYEREGRDVNSPRLTLLSSVLNYGGSHPLCPHPHSCLHYWLKNGAKLFSIGCGLQLSLKLLLQMNKIMKRPKVALRNVFQLDTLRLGAFFAGFGGLFRVISCSLRRLRNHDSEVHAVPAGLTAGLAFFFFRDNTAALYAMWKTIQIFYNMGVDKGHLPPFPGGSVFVHAFATAILFHAAVLEPHNVRPSYWRFLTNISGNRVNNMNRECLDVFGLESSKSLKIAQDRLLRR